MSQRQHFVGPKYQTQRGHHYHVLQALVQREDGTHAGKVGFGEFIEWKFLKKTDKVLLFVTMFLDVHWNNYILSDLP